MAHSAQHHLFRSGSLAGSIHTPNTVVLIQAQTFLGDQEWFPVMPGIWIAGVAIASAPWFVCAVGNFKICQKRLCHSQKLSFETLVSRVKYCGKLQSCKIHVCQGPPEHSQGFLGTDRDCIIHTTSITAAGTPKPLMPAWTEMPSGTV